MNPATEQIFHSVLALPDAERLLLLNALIEESKPPSTHSWDELWLAEIQRRSAEIDSGTATLISWDEVKRSARESLEPQSDEYCYFQFRRPSSLSETLTDRS